MKLIRILAIAAVAWIIYSLVKRGSNRTPSVRKTPNGREEAMVKCAHCGVHVPASEAIHAHGQSYCSERHRDADSR